MKTIRKVMAAIDFSEHSKDVLESAGTLAVNAQAEMIIVNVINKRDIETVENAKSRNKSNSMKEWIEQQKKERRLSIQNLIEKINLGDLPIKIVVREGRPSRELLKEVGEEGADIVVMGIKGRFKKREIGSTAEKMCERCPVALLTVRPQI